MEKTFYLGLGGQKCGSTWMQAFLNAQPGSDFGRLGEYQVWEHHLGGVFSRYKTPEPSFAQKFRARFKMALSAPEPNAHLRWRLQRDPAAYFDYFDKICQGPTQRTGDVTPSYAALTPELLSQIRQGLETRGFAVKVLFSMRDPVNRIRSHMRMEMAKGRLPASQDNEAPLRAFYASDEAAARTRYDTTLETIDAVFDRKDQYICLFEELVAPGGLQPLAKFAGVTTDVAIADKFRNQRPSGQQVSPALSQQIANHYQPVYTAVAKRLPHIQQLWPSASVQIEPPE